MRRSTLVLVIALGASSVACGGTDEGRPDGTPSEQEQSLDPCQAAAGYTFETLVDFEPMPGEMPETTRSQNCRAETMCTYNFNFDAPNTPGHELATGACPEVVYYSDPTYMQSNLQGQPAGTRCGEPEYATRVTATNLAVCTNDQGRQGWGGSLSLTFADSADDERLDASDWDGFSFWVKKASPATRSAFISAAADGYTAGYVDIEGPFGTDSCDASGNTFDANGNRIPDTEKCDGFGVAVTLSDEWTFVPVRFAAMRQKGFGMPSHVGHLVTEELVRLQFLMSAGDWDVWIDDIAFFREPAP